MAWTKEKIDLLIDLYQERELLYNTIAKDYHNKQKRQLAIKEIATVLELTAEDVKKKLIGLRTQYSSENQKVVSSPKSGSGASDIYRSKWAYYDRLSFLAAHITPRRSQSSLPSGTQDCGEEDLYETTRNVRKTSSGKKRSIREEDDLVLKEASESLRAFREQRQAREDEHDLFCRYLVNQLRKIKNPETASNTHVKIMNLVLEVLHAENQQQEYQQQAPICRPSTDTWHVPSQLQRSRLFGYFPSSSSPLSRLYQLPQQVMPSHLKPASRSQSTEPSSRSQSPCSTESSKSFADL